MGGWTLQQRGVSALRTVYLCGHTGSENRGCEAIVRSTAALLREAGQNDVRLLTFAAEQDEALDVKRISYPKKTLPQRAAGWFMREVMGDGVYGSDVCTSR